MPRGRVPGIMISMPDRLSLDGNIVAAASFSWRRKSIAGHNVWLAGDEDAVRTILAAAQTPCDDSGLCDVIGKQPGPFAAIAETDDYVIAFTDHCRTWPVFYTEVENQGLFVSNDANMLRLQEGLSALDDKCVLEALASGYTLSRQTLYQGLFQLRSGELLIKRRGQSVMRMRTFLYNPVDGPPNSDEIETRDYLDALGRALNTAFVDVVQYANGSPILVPLSGGLDSRLVVAKLKELNYPDIRTFSYGPPGNAEARIAKSIAEKLSLPWQFVETGHKESRAFFNSNQRRTYSQYSDNCSSVPNYQDLHALLKLQDAGSLPKDAVIVNGQTGDFISGGHIPLALVHDPQGNFSDEVMQKHCSLWGNVLTDSKRNELRARISRDIDDAAVSGFKPSHMSAAASFERWEYEERQAKYIINGQRSYEFMNLRWRLPLWHREVVEAFMNTPLCLRSGQKLYRQYLNEWNFANLFLEFNPTVGAWSRGLSAAIVPASIATRLLLGRKRRDRLIRYLRYFDRYGNHYGVFGWKKFAANVHLIRNPIALYTEDWLNTHGVPVRDILSNNPAD